MTRNKEMRIPTATVDAQYLNGDSIISVDSYAWKYDPIRPSVKDLEAHRVQGNFRIQIAGFYAICTVVGLSLGAVLAFASGYCR